MVEQSYGKLNSSIFLTFSGNCKKALTFYQSCFGGHVQFEIFENEIEGYPDQLVVSGSLVSDRITIYGSDLGPGEGRKMGNHMSIYLRCENIEERRKLIDELRLGEEFFGNKALDNQKLIELTDFFQVNWILGV